MIRRSRPRLTAVAILSVLGGWVAWEFYAGAALNAKVLPLRERAMELDRLGKDNRHLKAEISRVRELRRIKGEEINTLSLQLSEAEGRAPTGFKPAGGWHNSGNATPGDAYETYIWAIDRGDTKALSGVLSVDPASQAKIAEVYATLPAEARAEYGSPEALFALLFSNQNPVWFTAVDVAGQTQDQDNAAKLTLELQYPGGQVREHSFYFSHSPDGWRRFVTDWEVDYILANQLGVSTPNP
jgi:hypothetical protein